MTHLEVIARMILQEASEYVKSDRCLRYYSDPARVNRECEAARCIGWMKEEDGTLGGQDSMKMCMIIQEFASDYGLYGPNLFDEMCWFVGNMEMAI
jgi:hypothetical protein